MPHNVAFYAHFRCDDDWGIISKKVELFDFYQAMIQR
jgi:hypothetical protein